MIFLIELIYMLYFNIEIIYIFLKIYSNIKINIYK